MNYDALDSLIYLHKTQLLDAIAEHLGESFGYPDENENVATACDMLDHLKKLTLTEIEAHYDGRTAYSNGTPWERVERYASTEPAEDGTEEPVITECTVTIHPNNTPAEPLHPGGIWAK